MKKPIIIFSLFLFFGQHFLFSYGFPFMLSYGAESVSLTFSRDQALPDPYQYYFEGDGAYFAYGGPRIVDELFLVAGYRLFGSFDSSILFSSTFQSIEAGIIYRDNIYFSFTSALMTISEKHFDKVKIVSVRSILNSSYLNMKFGFTKRADYMGKYSMFFSGGLSLDYLAADRFVGWYPGLFVTIGLF